MQYCVGSTQHFDSLDGAGIDGIDLRLAIYCGQGNAIQAYTHAADAKGSAGTKSPNRDARILCKVIAVLYQYAGRQVRSLGTHSIFNGGFGRYFEALGGLSLFYKQFFNYCRIFLKKKNYYKK